jgi:hypothetical protein
MKFKITVEGEEGVKCVRTIIITSEATMLAINGKMISGDTHAPISLEDYVVQEVAANARHAARRLFKWFKNHGMLVQRNKDGVRECHPVKDIDVAGQWLMDGDR